jgi:hypothetical protein
MKTIVSSQAMDLVLKQNETSTSNPYTYNLNFLNILVFLSQLFATSNCGMV